MGRDRAQLAEFLRSRRARLTPAQAGIDPLPGERRVPGLRRQELATLAGVSVDYYTRLEQGRQANVSREVLDALARALRLDPVERAHLDDLAAPASAPSRAATERPQRPDPGLLRVLGVVDHVPAVVIGRRGVVLACNALFRWLVGTHPQWPGASAADPLVLELEGTRYEGGDMQAVIADELEMWEEEGDDEPFQLPVAPDALHKDNVSGGLPYGIVLPDAAADARIVTTDEMFLVDYVRLAFDRGGFPGCSDGDATGAVITSLRADLLRL